MEILITDVQRFCMHDGPGIRTTVFLKGCPLRCRWCHNPETQKREKQLLFYRKKCIGCRSCAGCPQGVHVFRPEHMLLRENCIACGLCQQECPTGALEISGRLTDTETILKEVQQDLAFYTRGGVTLSGGEPFYQPEAALDLLRRCREAGISTAVETSGFFPPELLSRAIENTDLFLWDVKDTDSRRHRAYTGVPNERILENLHLADAMGARTRLRCIVVRGVNAEQAHYEALARLALTLKNCEGVEFLPYHAYAGDKTEFLGGENSGNPAWIPTREDLDCAESTVKRFGVRVIGA